MNRPIQAYEAGGVQTIDAFEALAEGRKQLAANRS